MNGAPMVKSTPITTVRHALLALTLLFTALVAVALAQGSGSRDVSVSGQTLKASFPSGFGVGYVPANDLAQALGLGTQVGGDWINLTLGGTVLQLALADTALEASRYSRALTINGRQTSGPAAGYQGGEIYVPLRAVVEALGGTMQDAGGRITVVFAPVQLKEVSKSTTANADRAVLELSSQASFSARVEGDEAVVLVRNARGENVRYSVGGDFIKEVEVRTVGTDLEARLRLPSGSGFRAFALPPDLGADAAQVKGRVAIDVGPAFERPEVALEARPLVVVLDAAHGGADAGVVEGNLVEKTLALTVARLIGANLSSRGLTVRYTRSDDSNPSLAARRERLLASDAFVSLHVSSLPGSSASGVSVYSLDKNTVLDGMLRGGRQALAETSSEARRKLLEHFLSPADAGEALSDAILGRVQALEEPKVPIQALTTASQVLLSHAPKSAVVVELGWLSDEKDRTRLGSRKELERLASAIAAGLLDHLAPSLPRRAGTTGGTPPAPPATTQPAPPTGKP
jgi:N-acetylmuramoyl-L-alanine amidase